MAELAPSLFAADYFRMGEQFRAMEEEGVRLLHLDVMDGQFVPGFSFGPDFIKNIRPHSRLLFDVHLMTVEPEALIGPCAEAGADVISLHLEAFGTKGEAVAALRRIHSLGRRAGLVLKPETPLSEVTEKLWRELDVIQLMTVAPGRQGQSFLSGSIEKIGQARAMARVYAPLAQVEADGGINKNNLEAVLEAGAGIVVVGKGLFQGNLRQNLRAYQNILGASSERRERWQNIS